MNESSENLCVLNANRLNSTFTASMMRSGNSFTVGGALLQEINIARVRFISSRIDSFFYDEISYKRQKFE